jgi:iron complex transport system substrate-binding protein
LSFLDSMALKLNVLTFLVLLASIALPTQGLAVEVTDSLDRQVILAQPAKRVITLAPHLVENLFSAGGGGQIVGTVSYSNYPEAAKSLPLIGSFNAFSLERILALQPDLVLLWGSGNGLQALEQLQQLGLPVYVDELRTLEDMYQSIRNLGVLTGFAATAEQEATRLKSGFTQLGSNHQDLQPLGVFYQIWHEPLQTLNGDHLINEVIELCGGANIFADAVSLAPKVNLESVLDRNPDVIVASGMSEVRPAWLKNWESYPQLKAVRNNALFAIDPDQIQRPTARLLTGATELCAQLDSVRNTEPAAH